MSKPSPIPEDERAQVASPVQTELTYLRLIARSLHRIEDVLAARGPLPAPVPDQPKPKKKQRKPKTRGA